MCLAYGQASHPLCRVILARPKDDDGKVYIQKTAAKTIGGFGAAAKKYVPRLKKIASETAEPEVRKAIETAIARIGAKSKL
jgi:hypothetical protein